MSDFPDPSIPEALPQAQENGGTRGLTPAQRRFLRAMELDCDPTSASSARILGKLPLTRMAEWLGNPAFHARIDQLLDMVAKKRGITLQIASGRAADRLDASFDAPAGDPAALSSEQRRTCLDLVKLVESRRGPKGESEAKPRQTRTAGSAKSGAAEEISSTANLAHPDLPPQEALALKQRLDASASDEATNAP